MKYYFSILWLTLFCTAISFAQDVNIKQLEGLKIRNIGPAGMSGRVTAIDVIRQQPDVIYIGTASGGVWKSESGGINWQPIFDEQAVQSVGALAINQQNPAEIWVGTGEGNPRNSHNSGEGIYKSIDGGKNWTLMGLENTRNIHRILIHKDNPNIVYVGVLGSAWGKSEERGVYRTLDGGKNWKKILYVDEQTGVADMIIDPHNPNKLLVAMWEFGRQPWFFNSGGEGSGLYRTYDRGDNWTQIKTEDGLPKGPLGRMGLAMSYSSPNIIYALIEAKKNGLYKSTDGGHKWQKVSEKNIGNRPFYYAEIYVDPQNENRIWNLWSYVSKSEDGGKTFKTVMDYGTNVHPDHHAFYIHPDNPDFLLNGNDGGLNISRDGGKTWRFVTNLPLAQFYHINYDMDYPYNVCGGMQDNGSWVGPSYVWKNGGIRNNDWAEVFFGDGFDVLLRRDDNRYGWAMSQGGNLTYFDRKTGQTKYVKPLHPDGVQLRYSWNAALAQNPEEDCGIYYGSQFVHKSMDCGDSWEIISPDLTTNDTTKQKQGNSGGLTPDVTGAENFTTILCIAPSPVDPQLIWVGTDDGNLQLTRDGGKNWENLAAKLPGCPAGSWIPQIEVSTKNAGEAFVVVNNYRRNDWKPYLYHTDNYGKSWKRLADASKVSGHCLAVVQDIEEPNLLFLGTDYGLYVSFNKGTSWQKWTNDFPSVSTRDLKIHPREHDLIVGTFGRAAWILDDIRPLRAIASSKGGVLAQDFKAFKAPDAYLASYRSVDGIRFVADGEYSGSNRSRGAMLSLWVKPTEKEKEKEKAASTKSKKAKQGDSSKEEEKKEDKKPSGAKDKKVKVQVFSASGDTLNTFYRKLEKEGMNRIAWNLRRKGARMPSRNKPKPKSNDPWGPRVLPGTYKLVFTYGDFKDSTSVTVRPDPRRETDMSKLTAQQKAYDDHYLVVDKARESFDRLLEVNKTVKLINDQMLHVPDSVKKQIADAGKVLTDSTTQLMELYMPPAETKGIVRNNNKLNSLLWRAGSYIGASQGPPNQMARFASREAKDRLQTILQRINQFFDTEWKAYREKVEAVQYSLFKDYESIKME
ncbi:MAG: hypothetical protein AAF990_03650 [Bacteroidota bacterium]